MNDKNLKPETAIKIEGVRKGLTTPIVPTVNQPAETPSNQPSSTPTNHTNNSNENR